VPVKANSGGVNKSPVPSPATIWNAIMGASEEVAESVVYKEEQMTRREVPIQMSRR